MTRQSFHVKYTKNSSSYYIANNFKLRKNVAILENNSSRTHQNKFVIIPQRNSYKLSEGTTGRRGIICWNRMPNGGCVYTRNELRFRLDVITHPSLELHRESQNHKVLLQLFL